MKKMLLVMSIMGLMAVVLYACPLYATVVVVDPPPEEEPAPAEQPQTQPTTPDSLGELVVEMPNVMVETPATLPAQEITPAGSGEPAATTSGLAGAPQVPEAEAGGASGYDDIAIEDDLVAQPE